MIAVYFFGAIAVIAFIGIIATLIYDNKVKKHKLHI
jgi:hypothetical protein